MSAYAARRARRRKLYPCKITFHEFMKDAYPATLARPKWAKYARAHRWMTLEEYFAVPPSDPGPTLQSLMYTNNPVFKLFPKDTKFS